MRVNELSVLTVTVNLLEGDLTAALPTSVHWRLKCLETDAVLQDWTEATYTTVVGNDESIIEAEATINVSGQLHGMQTSNRAVEKKALTISADKGLATEFNDELVYEVERLKGRS